MTPFPAPDNLGFVDGVAALGLTVFDNVYNTVQGRPLGPPVTRQQVAGTLTGVSAIASIPWRTVLIVGVVVWLMTRHK